jgi:hypothetical protein
VFTSGDVAAHRLERPVSYVAREVSYIELMACYCSFVELAHFVASSSKREKYYKNLRAPPTSPLSSFNTWSRNITQAAVKQGKS